MRQLLFSIISRFRKRIIERQLVEFVEQHLCEELGGGYGQASAHFKERYIRAALFRLFSYLHEGLGIDEPPVFIQSEMEMRPETGAAT